MNSHAKTVELALTVRIPNIQLSPRRGRRTSTATNRALQVMNTVDDSEDYFRFVQSEPSINTNLPSSVEAFKVLSFFCLIGCLLVFNNVCNARTMKNTLTCMCIQIQNHDPTIVFPSHIHTNMMANIGATKPNIIPFSTDSQQLHKNSICSINYMHAFTACGNWLEHKNSNTLYNHDYPNT